MHNNKIIGVLMAAVLGLAGIFAGAAFCQDDIMRVEDSGFAWHRRPAVGFLHDEHNEAAGIDDCAACHHVVEDGVVVEDETSEDMECSECHLADGNPNTLAEAYHGRCKGCHQQRETGPVQCAQCHKIPR